MQHRCWYPHSLSMVVLQVATILEQNSKRNGTDTRCKIRYCMNPVSLLFGLSMCFIGWKETFVQYFVFCYQEKTYYCTALVTRFPQSRTGSSKNGNPILIMWILDFQLYCGLASISQLRNYSNWSLTHMLLFFVCFLFHFLFFESCPSGVTTSVFSQGTVEWVCILFIAVFDCCFYFFYTSLFILFHFYCQYFFYILFYWLSLSKWKFNKNMFAKR